MHSQIQNYVCGVWWHAGFGFSENAFHSKTVQLRWDSGSRETSNKTDL